MCLCDSRWIKHYWFGNYLGRSSSWPHWRVFSSCLCILLYLHRSDRHPVSTSKGTCLIWAVLEHTYTLKTDPAWNGRDLGCDLYVFLRSLIASCNARTIRLENMSCFHDNVAYNGSNRTVESRRKMTRLLGFGKICQPWVPLGQTRYLN